MSISSQLPRMLVWHSWAPCLPESSCRHLLLKLVKSSSLASPERVPLALSFTPKCECVLEGFPLVFLSLRPLCSSCPVAGLVPQPHVLAVSRAHSVTPCAEVQLLIPTQMSLQWDPWCCPKTHCHWQISKASLDSMAKVTKPHNLFFFWVQIQFMSKAREGLLKT